MYRAVNLLSFVCTNMNSYLQLFEYRHCLRTTCLLACLLLLSAKQATDNGRCAVVRIYQEGKLLSPAMKVIRACRLSVSVTTLKYAWVHAP